MSKQLGRVTFLFAIGIIIVFTCLLLFSYIATWWYPEFHGSHSLGNNIYMLDWDGGGKIIVRGTSLEGNTCYGGERLIPDYDNQYDSTGNFAEYVVDAICNEHWVIAKTDNKNTAQRKYYIINKRNISDDMPTEEIIKSRVECFSDSIKFVKRCTTYGINLETFKTFEE